MTDEYLDPAYAPYFVVSTREYDNGDIIDGLWCQAVALAEGVESRTKHVYVQLRSKQLINDSSIKLKNGKLIQVDARTADQRSWAHNAEQASKLIPIELVDLERKTKCYGCYGSGYRKDGIVCVSCRGSGFSGQEPNVIMKNKPSNLPSKLARYKLHEDPYSSDGDQDVPDYDYSDTDDIHDTSVDINIDGRDN